MTAPYVSGTITANNLRNGPLTKYACGSYEDTAGSPTTPAVIALGFFPVAVDVYDETDVILYKWFVGMTNDYALKINGTGPTVTEVTSGGITAKDTTPPPSTIVAANAAAPLDTTLSDANYNKGLTTDVGTIAPGEQAVAQFSFPVLQNKQYRWFAIG